ncbi:MAG: LysR family transcriptional regulator [Alphaproteobacteria bacterium]|nr:LysR family transcriptional regulator [Alphaproteobacteria bacterium]MCB9690754.1 LysR family transcriptional regulator [Alphaproteobacteria bacterium]
MDASWDDWQVVVVAWRTGSFSAAADALGIAQATVSRRVARLEEQVGHALFDRHRTGLVPTPAAHALRPHLEALEAAAVGARRALEGLETDPEGTVRITAPPAMCVDWMPTLALRLRERHPALRLEVIADVARADLGRREADLAVRAMPTDDPDLLIRRITTLSGGLYASADLVAGLPDPCTLADVPLVTWSSDFAHIAVARFLAGLSSRPPAFMANDHLVLREAVRRGLGASLFGDREAATVGLVPVPVALPELPGLPIYLVVHRALRGVPRVRAVIEAIDALVEEVVI